ncbi:hypothetical protein PsorP6_008481 [Peronosclerospora sorghi]|uniref:Uncharacterized protein n=1 Tax=Peronosclerospora sorghi TaxID=230839 RepID=A0ACC0W6D3_9STRA|nr:hypothetical protein PsorP6_008481 [Peronosclerospora sorghi]
MPVIDDVDFKSCFSTAGIARTSDVDFVTGMCISLPSLSSNLRLSMSSTSSEVGSSCLDPSTKRGLEVDEETEEEGNAAVSGAEGAVTTTALGFLETKKRSMR